MVLETMTWLVTLGDRPVWERDGHDWPLREHSQFVRAAGLKWHVQRLGQGPTLLLAHGTGAATHSWRDLMPALAEHFDVVSVDLPGHGFTDLPGPAGLSLDGMAKRLRALLEQIDARPAVGVGHSAGAAILSHMTARAHIDPRLLVGLNGAFLPYRGSSGRWYPALAKLMMWNPIVPRSFAWRAGDRETIERLLTGVGSTLSDQGVELYRRLASRTSHVTAAFGMMANWNLHPLQGDLSGLGDRLVLVVAEGDKAVPAASAKQVLEKSPGARVITQPDLGHLSHEEDPEGTARIIRDLAHERQILG